MHPNSCFFIGHRDTSDSDYGALLERIEQVIAENHIAEFYVGNHGNFDALAARAIMAVKAKRPEIRLYLVLPHPRRFLRLPDGFDGVFCPPDLPQIRYALVLANRYMVDHVRCLIADTYRRDSNSYRLLQYAQRRQARGELRVENLTEPLPGTAKKPAPASALETE